MEDFDDLLNILGTGKWNLVYYIGMSMSFFAMPCFIFSSAFLAPNTPYSCDVPSGFNETEVSITNDDCSFMYLDKEENENVTESCTSWTYAQPESIETLTSEFDLICDKAYLRPTYQTMHMTGAWVGALVNGYVSDKFGRIRIVTITLYAVAILTFLLTFISNLTAILILRLCIGLTSSGIFQTGYILCMEITNPKHRSTVGILIALPWAFGMMWWGALGYLVRDWRWLQRASEAPFIIVFIFLFLMNESPRWLIINGRHKEALKNLRQASKWNKTSLPNDNEMYRLMGHIEKESRPVLSQEEKSLLQKCFDEIFKLFKAPEVRKRLLLTMVIFVITSTVYIGLALNAVNFNLNPYMYMVVGGLMEIPAYTIIVPIISKFGRIKPTAIAFFFCGVAIMTLAFIPREMKWLIITLAMSGKCANAAAFQIVFLIASEIFPTDVRIQALGTLSFVSTLSVTAPYITELVGADYPWLPSIIFGVLSFMASLAAVFLPETLNIHLPETIEQLEKEIKDQKRQKRLKVGDKAEMDLIKIAT